MPPLRVLWEGCKRFREVSLGVRSPMLLVCHLFKVDHTPATEDDPAIYHSGEADFSGYAAPQMSGFLPATQDPLNPDRWVCNCGGPVEFIWQTGGTVGNAIYGYFWTDEPDHAVLLAGRFDNVPIYLDGPGRRLSFTPVLSERSEYL